MSQEIIVRVFNYLKSIVRGGRAGPGAAGKPDVARCGGVEEMAVPAHYTVSGIRILSPGARPAVDSKGCPLSCQISYWSELVDVLFPGGFIGTFVEVGAFDGFSFSNTWMLADRGWRGLMIEANLSYAEVCRQNHSRHPAVNVANYAIGSIDGSTVSLCCAGALSTCDTQLVEEMSGIDWAPDLSGAEWIEVPTRTLDSLLAEYRMAPNLDMVVVDVEGWECEVLAGFDLDRWQPKVIVIEIADFHPDFPGRRSEGVQLTKLICSLGYSVCYKDIINTVFVRQEYLANLAGPVF